jgi:hypothetical protein
MPHITMALFHTTAYVVLWEFIDLKVHCLKIAVI